MNTKSWTAVLSLGFVSLVGGYGLFAADQERLSPDQLGAKMKNEGWTEVSKGVFKRRLGANKVERLGYGREGLAWTIGELTRRIERLQQEQESYPSAELAEIIEDLRAHLAKSKAGLAQLDSEPEDGLSSVTAAACSSVTYSATADAYSLTGTAGVGAVADASFSNGCGELGDTFAYAYARATQGTNTVALSDSDPRSGTSVASHAAASVNGTSVTGIPCYSEASSFVQSSALGISYSTSDSNGDCSGATPPVVPEAHTWVSGVGNDSNTCSRIAPCKTFAGAIDKTAAGGEILVLDPGSYGTVTITKSITINGAGQLADIQAAGSNGITVNAGVNDKVILRNLSINGAGTGLNGVRYLAGKQVVLENVTIDGFTTRGIDVALSGSGRLEMSNVSITNVPTGVRLSTTAGAVTAILQDIRLNTLANFGLETASPSAFATIRNSVITSCGNALRAGANASVINAENNDLSFNVTAVNAAVSGSTVRLSGNAIYNNATGIAFSAGAVVQSDGTNRIAGNTATTPPNAVVLLD
jgi:hypothetical protein